MSLESMFLNKDDAKKLAKSVKKYGIMSLGKADAFWIEGHYQYNPGKYFLYVKKLEIKKEYNIVEKKFICITETPVIETCYYDEIPDRGIPTFTSEQLFTALPEPIQDWYYELLDGNDLEYDICSGAKSGRDIADDLKKIIRDNKPNNLQIYFELVVYCVQNELYESEKK